MARTKRVVPKRLLLKSLGNRLFVGPPLTEKEKFVSVCIVESHGDGSYTYRSGWLTPSELRPLRDHFCGSSHETRRRVKDVMPESPWAWSLGEVGKFKPIERRSRTAKYILVWDAE